MTALKAHGPLHHGGTKIINTCNELIPFYNKLFYDCRQFSKGNGYKFYGKNISKFAFAKEKALQYIHLNHLTNFMIFKRNFLILKTD
jgi:hypothetical protein